MFHEASSDRRNMTEVEASQTEKQNAHSNEQHNEALPVSGRSSHSQHDKDDSISHTASQDSKDIEARHHARVDNPPSTPAHPPSPPPDGGYGWVVVICAALINFNTWGINSSYGVFLAYYLANNVFPEATRLDYAFIGGLSIGGALLFAPVATSSVRLFGTKRTLLIGIFFETVSLIAASFARRIWQLYLSQGLCFGIGMGFLFVASVGLASQFFTTRRSLANGITAAGSGLGGLTWSLGIGSMIRTVGLAWSFRIAGIVTCAANIVCVILIRDRNKIIGSSQNAFDIKLFKRVEYLLLCAYSFFSLLGYVVLIFSLANYANTIGLTADQAAIVSAIFNLGQATGRPPIGYFSDSFGRINMAATMTFLCGLFSLVIWLNAHSFGVLIFFAIVGGMVAGTVWAIIAPVSAEVVGLKDVPSALNLLWLVITLPSIMSEPIALEIIAGTGSYTGTILFTTFMYFAAALCLLLLRGWKIQELRLLADRQAVNDRALDASELQAVPQQARRDARKGMFKEFWKTAKV